MYKTAKTVKDYHVEHHGYKFTIPKGSIVSNSTALGHDDNYHFWRDFEGIAKKLTGFKRSMLHHDLEHYGINIPAEYCEEYKK